MSAKPRILAFITSYFPDVGGAEVALRQVAERLSHQFEFHIITSRRRRGRPPCETLKEGRLLSLGTGRSVDKWLLPWLTVIRRPDLAADGDSPQLLWGIDTTQAALAAAWLRRLNPAIPLVLTLQYGEDPDHFERGRWGLIRRSFRSMLSQADHVTAISTPLAALTRRHGYPGPVTIIPNGVDTQRFRRREPRDPSAPPTVVSVGRLVHKNGTDTLLRAIGRLSSDFPDLRCRLIGDGPERSRLEHLARDLGLADRVVFDGAVPHDAVAQGLWAGDVFVRPSRSEGMGTAFVEALAAGLPVIGTPVGGIPDVIRDGETGLLTPVDQPDDLAEKIRLLLSRNDLAASLAARGLAMVQERFEADGIAARYARVFREVIPS